MKSLIFYGRSVSYNAYLVDKLKYFDISSFRGVYSMRDNFYKNTNYLKLINKFRKKNLFFDKFLLKFLITKRLRSNTYIQQSLLNKFFRTFIISGKKLKVYNATMYSFYRLYSIVNLDIYKNLASNYLYFKEFLFNKELNKELNNVVSIVDWLFFWYQPIFSVKCSLVPKKYRKKLKKKYIYAVNYVDPLKRKNVSLRWILHFLDSFNNYKFNSRLFLLLSDLIFNFKKSIVYDRKVRMYRKMFKI